MVTRTRHWGWGFALAAGCVGLTLGAGCHRQAPGPEVAQTGEALASYVLDLALDRIEADEAQRDEFHAAMDWFVAELRKLAEKRRQDKTMVVEELLKDRPDAEKLHDLVDDRVEEHRRLGHDVVDTVLALHEKLSPEQRVKLAKVIEQHMQRMKELKARLHGGERHKRFHRFIHQHLGSLFGKKSP